MNKGFNTLVGCFDIIVATILLSITIHRVILIDGGNLNADADFKGVWCTVLSTIFMTVGIIKLRRS